MAPRIVFTTNDSLQGQRIFRDLVLRGVRVDAVLLLGGDLAPPRGRKMGLLRRLLRWPRSIAGALRDRWRIRREGRRAVYGRHCADVEVTGRMNSRSMQRALRRRHPDFLVLGGGGILDEETIAIARQGVLNAHPALLPWVRGNGGVGHSLALGVAVGATVHYVDRTIDTGPIVARRLLAVPAGPLELRRLEEDNANHTAALMAAVVEQVVRGESAPPGAPQAERHPLLRWPDAATRDQQDALARKGRAGELFAAWSALCPGEDWLLPDGVTPPDSVTAPSRAG